MNHRNPRERRNAFWSRYPDDPDDPINIDIPSDYFFPIPDRDEYFGFDHPERMWPAHEFGMDVMDLFHTLTKEFNTITMPMLDIEAFNRDVCEMATVAKDKQDFYRLLAERRDLRRQELLRMLRTAMHAIATDPGLLEDKAVTAWGNAMQIAWWKSFDAYVGYFTGYLDDIEPSESLDALHDAAAPRSESPVPSRLLDGTRTQLTGVKRPATDARGGNELDGSPRSSKRARTDASLSQQPSSHGSAKRSKRSSPDSGDDQQPDGSPRSSKRARTAGSMSPQASSQGSARRSKLPQTDFGAYSQPDLNDFPHSWEGSQSFVSGALGNPRDLLKRQNPFASLYEQQEETSRASKRARTDDGLTEPAHIISARTASPQLQPEESPAIEAYWQKLARQAQDRARQAEDYVRRARQEYAAYSRSRQQDPATFSTTAEAAGSNTDGDSSQPHNHDMEDQDPAVAEIFGPEFAARLRTRRSRTQLQQGPLFSWLFPDFVPEGQPETDNNTDRAGAEADEGTNTESAIEAVLTRGQEHQQAGRPRRPRAPPRQRRTPREHASPNKKQAPKPQSRRRSTRDASGGKSSTAVTTPQPPRRHTRRSGRNEVLYELDDRCGARRV
ncbi:hypothetical protein VPNG_04639 [Cytospora leucostoma]|uniref:Uncharacterized protein n=1 Tax=Cytospora leucostoma TaxID=1230097 RepID=A0A423XCB7_9PEZI|nr:hypothetical protein VPNG_04639 [Cytospora leucostoma]